MQHLSSRSRTTGRCSHCHALKLTQGSGFVIPLSGLRQSAESAAEVLMKMAPAFLLPGGPGRDDILRIADVLRRIVVNARPRDLFSATKASQRAYATVESSLAAGRRAEKIAIQNASNDAALELVDDCIHKRISRAEWEARVVEFLLEGYLSPVQAKSALLHPKGLMSIGYTCD